MRPLIRVLPLLTIALLAACESPSLRAPSQAEPSYEEARNLPLRAANYAAADELMKRVNSPATTSNRSAGGDAPLIIATLANIDALEQSSTLGRFVSEQVASRLTQTGRSVVELKVRNGIYMKRNEGEFLLTREIREVAAAHKAEGVIVGTYAESASFVHVTLKLVDPTTSLVLAAYDYSLPLDRQVKSMLIQRR